MREFRAGGKALPEDGGRQALNVAGAARDVAVAGADYCAWHPPPGTPSPVPAVPWAGTSKWSLGTVPGARTRGSSHAGRRQSMSSPGSREITRCPRHTHSSQGGGGINLHVPEVKTLPSGELQSVHEPDSN